MAASGNAARGGVEDPTIRNTAIIAGGCFWCLEAVFERLEGVLHVESGYIGGHVPRPEYHAVCSGETGHAEAIRITFDPSRIAYRELLECFFAFHDPTTRDRQGPDVGTQYRSAIFTLDSAQDAEARATIAKLNASGVFDRPIVTEVTPASTFWLAEPYHQQYYRKHPAQAYCAAMIAPKLAKLRKAYAARLKPDVPG